MNHFKNLVLILCMLSLTACIPKGLLGGYPKGLKGDAYVSEIVRIKESLKTETVDAKKAKLYLNLALLHASFENPEKDYLKAGKALDEYIKLSPGEEKDFEVQNLRTMLMDISKKGKNKLVRKIRVLKKEKSKLTYQKNALTSKNKKLSSAKKALEKNKKELTAKTRELAKTINKLRMLDMKLEEKRKSYK